MTSPEGRKPAAKPSDSGIADIPGLGTIVAGLDSARKVATDVIGTAREKGEAVIEDTREKGYRAAAETNRLFYEHPIAAVAAAAAAGAVFSIFLPRFTLGARAGKLAGRAVKAAAASEAAALLYSGLKDTRNAAVRSTAGKAASVVGDRIRSRRKPAAEPAPDAIVAAPVGDEAPAAEA